MNLFVTSHDLIGAASDLDDKRLVKAVEDIKNG